MATSDACSYQVDCETDCSRAEVRTFLRAVAEPRQQKLLSVLAAAQGESLSIDDVLDRLDVIGRKDRYAWSIDLHHRYLPRLVELEIATYDGRNAIVRYLGCPFLDEPVTTDELGSR